MVPEQVGGRLLIDAPPRQEPSEGLGGLLVMAMPMLGSVGSIVLVSTMGGAGGRQYVAAGMFLLATVGFVVVQADRQRAHRLSRSGGSRTAYARHLAAARATIRTAASAQRAQLCGHHPDPTALLAGRRVVERGPGHPYFLRVRHGVTPQPLALEVVAPREESTVTADPACAAALGRLLAVHAEVPALPALADLREVRMLPATRSAARALLCSATAAHAPQHLAVAVLADGPGLVEWDWLKWLPHLAVPPTGRHQLLVVDGVEPPPGTDGVTVLRIDEAAELVAGTDELSVQVAEAVARRLAPRTAPVDQHESFDWAPRAGPDRLRVVIGTTEPGRSLELDLKESALNGMGPHGLVVGATGSGKSELLRTLVLRLAMTHPPDDLNLVLVDFKGGATFAGLAALPHVSALITNLADELPLVERMQDALSGELVRRQELLRAAGVGSAREHGRMPSLLVVVDEFAELLVAKPELTDLFVAIGRLGRSLGLHLLLASQRLDEGRLRGLEAHLSYRIGLRTFSAQESRTVLGVPDAFELPPAPGSGFLRTGPAAPVRFTAAYVSAPVAEPARVDDEVRAFTVADAGPTPAPAGQWSVLDDAVRRLSGRGAAAHRIWLPPLGRPPALADLEDARRGPLVVPVGLADRPREQRQAPLVLDLAGAAGHVAVVGGPRSGKSMLLATLVASLARGLSPQELQVYVLDLGGTLAPLAGQPHVVARAARSCPDLVRRVVDEVRRLVERREADGRGRDGHGEVFLVVDGWSVLRSDFDDLEGDVQQVAARGLGVGVHVALAATRWADLRPSVRDLVGTRLELRLGDPADSEIDRRTAALVPVDRPGRGLTSDGLHFLAASPDAGSVWTGAPGPKLPVLPTTVALDRVDARRGGHLRLGLAERDLRTVGLDRAEPHLVVIGDVGAGKTSVLRLVAHEVARTRTPAEAQLVVVDPRRSLRHEVPSTYLLDAPVADLADQLRGRAPGWTGPDVFVLVDDHDLVVESPPPLHALVPLLPVARDVGLHLVLARRSGGAGRALFEPLLQTLRDLGAPGLLLSGDPQEGPLIGGVRPLPAPPGRGRLVTRERGVEVVQVAWVEPGAGYSASA